MEFEDLNFCQCGSVYWGEECPVCKLRNEAARALRHAGTAKSIGASVWLAMRERGGDEP